MGAASQRERVHEGRKQGILAVMMFWGGERSRNPTEGRKTRVRAAESAGQVTKEEPASGPVGSGLRAAGGPERAAGSDAAARGSRSSSFRKMTGREGKSR